MSVVFLQLGKAFMQIIICLQELDTVDPVSIHRKQALIVPKRPAHIVINVSKIMIDTINVECRSIL
ncbi:hypothetical protein D3C78_1452710 [compost metagenome]